MNILDGKLISNKIKEELKEEIISLEIKPVLAVIQVENDPASEVYIKNKIKKGRRSGKSIKWSTGEKKRYYWFIKCCVFLTRRFVVNQRKSVGAETIYRFCDFTDESDLLSDSNSI